MVKSRSVLAVLIGAAVVSAAVNRAWSDDELGGADGPDVTRTLDRHNYVETLLRAGM